MKTVIAAKRANVVHAGIPVKTPAKKASTSAVAARVMLGPAEERALPTRMDTARLVSWHWSVWATDLVFPKVCRAHRSWPQAHHSLSY